MLEGYSERTDNKILRVCATDKSYSPDRSLNVLYIGILSPLIQFSLSQSKRLNFKMKAEGEHETCSTIHIYNIN